ncbi:hypothetical protein Leryth_021927 [Lithospermum erythrorhizon]|nr:hypothetical protein Leryth_021927 [Lithospermum erythrorhizon]
MDSGATSSAAEVDQILTTFESSLLAIKWRIKHSSKLRLQTDILALWTEMRPVIMVDYGGKMPELQERLCAFLHHIQQQSSAFQHLRVMVIEEMIYLINVKALAEFVQSGINLERQTVFVDIEQEVPKIIPPADNSLASVQLRALQKLFSEIFPVKTVMLELSHYNTTDPKTNESFTSGTSHSSSVIDLTEGVQETQVTIPTLNGWLLGYPVVYFFSKDHIQDAIYNLSAKSLNIFQILVSRLVQSRLCSISGDGTKFYPVSFLQIQLMPCWSYL